MANEYTRREALRIALQHAASKERIEFSTEAINYFIDRAIRHINYRAPGDAARDHYTLRAIVDAPKLMAGIRAFNEGRVVAYISPQLAEEYTLRSVNCFFPFCRP